MPIMAILMLGKCSANFGRQILGKALQFPGSLVPRRFGLFTCARGTAREGEKQKIRREAPGRIRIQNGGSVFKVSVLQVFCIIYIIIEMTLFTAKYGFVHCQYSLVCNI